MRLVAVLAVLFAMGAGARAGTVVATEARLGEHPDATRFVLVLTGTVEYRVFTLADPYRVVIDLPDIDWRMDGEQGLTGRGVVKGYRYGKFRPGNSRVVLDLWKPAEVTANYIIPAEDGSSVRLVLDLAPADRESYLATAGWPDDPIAALIASEPPVEAHNEPPAPGHKPVIAVDAGHGGVDPGARGISGIDEKDVTLPAALALRDALEATGRYIVVMTRDTDVFLPLRERVSVARRGGADLFISLHADSNPKSRARGASVYTLSENASDAEAARLARSENQADIVAGVDFAGETNEVKNILIDLAQRETNNFSADLAELLTPELNQATGVVEKPHRFAGFAVLKAPDVPSVLIELGFLSNASDEASLTSGAWRSRICAAIVRAVDAYFAGRAQPTSRADAGEPHGGATVTGVLNGH